MLKTEKERLEVHLGPTAYLAEQKIVVAKGDALEILGVLAFATIASVASALAFGLAPALRGSRLSPQDGLRDGGRGTAGARSHWFQHSLIVVETALAAALLIFACLRLASTENGSRLWIRHGPPRTAKVAGRRFSGPPRRTVVQNASEARYLPRTCASNLLI